MSLFFVDSYVLFHFTILNSLQRIKKKDTISFEMLISGFLIVPFYLLKK